MNVSWGEPNPPKPERTFYTSDTTAGPQPLRFEDLTLESPSCPGGHVIEVDAYGERPVEYLDGAIAGYCCNCQVRVFFPRVTGGLVTAWVNALATQLLSGNFDADLLADFTEAMLELRADKEAVESALDTGALVKEVIAHRMRNES